MAIGFDSMGLQLYVAGDRQVRVFHNLTGYRVAITAAKEKLKDAKLTMASRTRFEQLVEVNETFLSQF